MNLENIIKNRKKIIIIAVIILVILIGAFTTVIILKKSSLGSAVKQDLEKDLMDGKNAIEIGLAEAKKWQADAELSYLKSDQVGQERGRSDNWQLIFVSKNIKDKGYFVNVVNFKVVEIKEVDYVGAAAEFPINAISQEEAISRVRKIIGYENVEILGVEAIYGSTGDVWYWGVKTNKGTVSVKAK
jgi:hypothetical protein